MNLSISFLLDNNCNGMSLQSLNNNWQIFTFLVMPSDMLVCHHNH
jgi:hypothetical protein